MSQLRSDLRPPRPDPARVAELAQIIGRIVDAFEAGAPTDALMAEHNRLSVRQDIPADRYQELYASMSEEDAAYEALLPKAKPVHDITRVDLEAIAALIIDPGEMRAQAYHLALFEANTPHGTSDLFFWPDPAWLTQLGTDTPTPSQYVDKALAG